MGLIDSHAHLTFPELSGQIDDVLDRCVEVGVDRIITIGLDLGDAKRAIDVARKYPQRVSVAVGFHPHNAAKVKPGDQAAMGRLLDDPLVVAFGEMGLDYYHDFADRASQHSVFTAQLRAGATRDLPLIIHCREAYDDGERLLIEHGFKDRRVVFHCFTGSADEARRIADNGWRISFTGIVTYRKSTDLQEIARTYPAEALMVETDSPYLSPDPLRGKRPNEPAYVVHTARFLALLRGVEFEELVEQTERNTRAFFGLPA